MNNQRGVIKTNYRYLAACRGFICYTKPADSLMLPGYVDVITARKIWVPGYFSRVEETVVKLRQQKSIPLHLGQWVPCYLVGSRLGFTNNSNNEEIIASAKP